VAAFVLFKILQSTAVIEKKEYQVGGAAAGFLLIYAALYGSYHQLQAQQADRLQTQLQQASQSLAECNKKLPPDVTIRGGVDPPIRDATVILGWESTTPDDKGLFILNTKGKPRSVYVITGKTHMSHTIFPDDDLSKRIKIP